MLLFNEITIIIVIGMFRMEPVGVKIPNVVR